jgi:hypothetical protein
MLKFIGTKIIHAEPMDECKFLREFKGRDTSDRDTLPGYRVVYPDGYVSWSPKAAFEEAYRPTDGMTFGLATEAMKKGFKVQRAGWNGKGQWVVLMPALYLPPYNSQTPGAKVNDRTARHIGVDTPLDSQPYFALWNAQGKWQPGWVPSTSDCLADDWMIVE